MKQQQQGDARRRSKRENEQQQGDSETREGGEEEQEAAAGSWRRSNRLGQGKGKKHPQAESRGVVDGALTRDTRRAVWSVAPDASVAGDGGWMARNDGGGAGGVG